MRSARRSRSPEGTAPSTKRPSGTLVVRCGRLTMRISTPGIGALVCASSTTPTMLPVACAAARAGINAVTHRRTAMCLIMAMLENEYPRAGLTRGYGVSWGPERIRAGLPRVRRCIRAHGWDRTAPAAMTVVRWVKLPTALTPRAPVPAPVHRGEEGACSGRDRARWPCRTSYCVDDRGGKAHVICHHRDTQGQSVTQKRSG